MRWIINIDKDNLDLDLFLNLFLKSDLFLKSG